MPIPMPDATLPSREYLLDLSDRLSRIFAGIDAPLGTYDILVLRMALSAAIAIWRPEDVSLPAPGALGEGEPRDADDAAMPVTGL
jgi:hypothetical protein